MYLSVLPVCMCVCDLVICVCNMSVSTFPMCTHMCTCVSLCAHVLGHAAHMYLYMHICIHISTYYAMASALPVSHSHFLSTLASGPGCPSIQYLPLPHPGVPMPFLIPPSASEESQGAACVCLPAHLCDHQPMRFSGLLPPHCLLSEVIFIPY